MVPVCKCILWNDHQVFAVAEASLNFELYRPLAFPVYSEIEATVHKKILTSHPGNACRVFEPL